MPIESGPTPSRPTDSDPDAASEKRELRQRSDVLMGELAHLKETEARKRETPISTEPFHALADEVTRSSERIFRIARRQDELGEEIPTGEDSIEEQAADGTSAAGPAAR